MAKREAPSGKQPVSLGYARNPTARKEGRTTTTVTRGPSSRPRNLDAFKKKHTSTLGKATKGPLEGELLPAQKVTKITPALLIKRMMAADKKRGRYKHDITGFTMQSMGIPTRRDDENRDQWLVRKEFSEVCAEYWVAGLTTTQLCEIIGINQFRMATARQAHPEIWDQAKAAKALMHLEAIDSDVDDVMHNRVSPDAARVLLSQRQLLAERLDPKAWSPKVKTELTGKDGGAVKVEQANVDSVLAKLGVTLA